jgi:hypothetical protein
MGMGKKENCMMRNLVLVVVLVLTFSALGMAQDLPQFELFGGWSYVRPDGGSVEGSPTNGWNASVTINITDMVGLVIDANGAYGNYTEHFTLYDGEEPYEGSVKAGTRFHSIAFGPRFTLRQHERYQPFYHAMMGLRHSSVDYLVDTETVDGDWISDVNDNFLMIFGGGMDIVVNPKFSIRAFQADYTLEKSYGDFKPDLRFATGLVFKFGEK